MLYFFLHLAHWLFHNILDSVRYMLQHIKAMYCVNSIERLTIYPLIMQSIRNQLTQSAHPSGDRRVISSVVIKTVQRIGNFSLWQISVLQPYCILYPCYWPYLDYDCSSTYSLYLCYTRSFPPSQDININMRRRTGTPLPPNIVTIGNLICKCPLADEYDIEKFGVKPEIGKVG